MSFWEQTKAAAANAAASAKRAGKKVMLWDRIQTYKNSIEARLGSFGEQVYAGMEARDKSLLQKAGLARPSVYTEGQKQFEDCKRDIAILKGKIEKAQALIVRLDAGEDCDITEVPDPQPGAAPAAGQQVPVAKAIRPPPGKPSQSTPSATVAASPSGGGGGGGFSAKDAQAAYAYSQANPEQTKAAVKFASEHKEDAIKAAKWAQQNPDQAKKAASLANSVYKAAPQ
eukprot:gb/GEZN01009686.1/.p1 GENE.gb/GEZN01009686.1/~~gb/GEZN01009686.1/.p1  ORF type:complete len:228 (+),score=52.95 gb/GEZN01009686.1/:31-714(+)